jgi:hypothetical protein
MNHELELCQLYLLELHCTKKLTYFAIQKKGILTSITLSLAQNASKAISKEERYIMQNLL